MTTFPARPRDPGAPGVGGRYGAEDHLPPKRLSARYWLDEATFGLQAAFQGEAREEKKIIRFPGAAGEEGGGERRGLRLGKQGGSDGFS